MMSRARFVYIVFFITAALVFTVHLRISSVRLFNRYRSAMVEQNRITQLLLQQQLRFDSLVSPAGLTSPAPQREEQ